MTRTEQVREALANVELALEAHGGTYNEDFHTLNGVDPQAWDMLEDSVPVIVEAARRWLQMMERLEAAHEADKAWLEAQGGETQ